MKITKKTKFISPIDRAEAIENNEMRRFKTKEEFQKFCDVCFKVKCGRLMTGLHERYCSRVRKELARLNKTSQKIK